MSGRLCFLFFLLVGLSCQTIIDVDIPHDKPMVVVNSLFSPDSVWKVQVSYSRNILDSRYGSFDPVGDAVVTIMDKAGQPIEVLKGVNNNFYMYEYKGKTKPLPGESYSVEVEVKDESFKSIGHIPVPVPITSVEVDSSMFESEEAVEMSISFRDPGEVRNYYEIKVLRKSFYLRNDNKDTVRFTEDMYVEPVDPALSNDSSNGSGKLFDDQLFSGKNYDFRVRLRSYVRNGGGTGVRVILRSVTEEYFNYFSSQSVQNNTQGDPFAQPALVYNNIENGLGIFAGFSSSVVEVK